MKRTALFFVVISLIGCGGSSTVKGPPCSIEDDGDGTFVLACSDGSRITFSNGKDGQKGDTGATGETGATGAKGEDGEDGSSCSVSEPEVGTKLITCGDGTSVSVRDGEQGPTGAACTTVDNGDGTKTVSCEDGTSATLHDAELCTVTLNGGGTAIIVSCPDGYTAESSAVIEGDVQIRSSLDVGLIKNYTSITGNLSVMSSVTNVYLPNLREVGGFLASSGGSPSSVASLEFPALTTVGMSLHISSNGSLTTLDMSALEEVGGVFDVTDNPSLPQCLVDEILSHTTVGGGIFTSGNDDIATCP